MNHQFFMQKALDLAANGWPAVAPNPMVACVIVHDEKIVAEGYHQQYGQAHAEVNAVAALPLTIKASECTVYVTLEPCSHFGKTPPCADLLISKGFRQVVVASKDPNPLVAGEGIKKMQEAGITVTTGVLEQEARFLNRRFYCFHEKNRPYITLKWAITANGFISRKPVPFDRNQNQITGLEANKMVHRLRSEHMAIMVGKNTVLADDPELTVRLVEGQNPIRITIDRHLELSSEKKIFNNDSKVMVFNDKKDEQKNHITFVKLKNNERPLDQICSHLHALKVQSLFVEGGSQLLQSFIDAGLWDEVFVFQNPDLYFENGVKGPVFSHETEFKWIGSDKLFHQLAEV